MGTCQSRDATMCFRSPTERMERSGVVRCRNDLSSKRSKVAKEPGHASPTKRRIKIIPDLDPPTEPCFSPSSTTVAETLDERSPSTSTLASLYFASPLNTVIPEEEDRDIPSDEEDSMYQTNDMPIDDTAGSIRKNLAKSNNSSAHRHVLHLTEPPPLSSDSNDAVSQDALTHFKSLKLHVKMQNKSNEKQRKQTKMEDRISDVQSYHQLWADYMELQQEVSSIDSEQNNVGTRQRSMGSFDLHESESWFFDFNLDFIQEDFTSEYHAGMAMNDDGSQCSQANLSLLSEQSLEAQRRYFAEKKNNKKRKKYGSGKSAKSSSGARTGGGSVSSMGSRDYGPVRSIPHIRLHDEVALRDMEVMVPDTDLAKNMYEGENGDNSSCVSDLGDESISSLFDYGVRRRRQGRKETTSTNYSKSLRSKLDSLEHAVAELQGSRNINKGQAEMAKLGIPESTIEHLSIIDVAAAATADMIVKSEYPEISYTTRKNARVESNFENETSLSTRDWQTTHNSPVLSRVDDTSSTPSDNLPLGSKLEHLQAVQETSYVTGDESSVNSDFGDLRSSIHGKSVLGNRTPGADRAIDSDNDRHDYRYPQENPALLLPRLENSWETPRKTGPPPSPVPESRSQTNGFTTPDQRQKRQLTEDQLSYYLGYSRELKNGDEVESPFQACSQASRLIQKSRSYVHSLSTEEFRRLSHGDPLSSWDPYQNAAQQPSDEDDSLDDAVQVLAPVSTPASSSHDENLEAESASPLENLDLVEKVESDMSRVLFNLRQTNKS